MIAMDSGSAIVLKDKISAVVTTAYERKDLDDWHEYNAYLLRHLVSRFPAIFVLRLHIA